MSAPLCFCGLGPNFGRYYLERRGHHLRAGYRTGGTLGHVQEKLRKDCTEPKIGITRMAKSPGKRKSRTWPKVVILVIIVLAVRTVCRIPRTGWSVGETRQGAAASETLRQLVAGANDIKSVILISIDTLRADHLGCYGYSRDISPNLDSLAAESLLFNHAITPIALTIPAHSSMMTGTNPYQHQVHDNTSTRLGESSITLAEILKEKGFATGAVIGAFALDARFGLNQGFDSYDDDFEAKDDTLDFLPFSIERKAEDVTRLALGWLDKHQAEEFFLFVHYYDPHDTYHWHEDTGFKYPSVFPSPADCYDSEIAYTDGYVGRIIETLKRKGLYDSTLLIVVGDHGEGLKDHKEGGHGFYIYHSTVHVPLIVKLPGVSTGVRINEVVGIIDIVPTVCELLGIEPPREVEGRNLLAGAPEDEERMIYCESMMPTVYNGQSLLGLVGNRYRYIHTTRPELYDLYRDPRENDDLIDEHPDLAAKFEDRLLATVSGMENRSGDSKIELDAESLARLAALGYVGGATEEDYNLEGTKEDPKDLVEFHEGWEEINLLIENEDFAAAKVQVLEAIAARPDFYDWVMSKVAAALATSKEVEVRDPEAAITIARHGVQITERRDGYSLRALTAAYEAAGRREEAERTARILRDLLAEKEKGTAGPPLPAHHSPRKRFENEK